MEKVLFVRGSYPINPRSYKIGEVIKKKYQLKFLFFDRKHLVNINDDNDFLYYRAPFVVDNKRRKLVSLIGLYKFLKRTIEFEKPEIVFAYHWDMFILSKLAIKNKNIRIIYDISDIPNFNGIKFKLIKRFEELFIKEGTDLIFASKFFEKFYCKFPNKKIVIDNKPVETNIEINHIDFNGKYQFNIVYAGNIKYKAILRNLVDAVKGLNVNLLFFGSGLDEDYMKKYCEEYENIYFFGRFSMEDLPSIYKIGDLAWAAYPSESINVKFATSNKYFESLVYKVPCIFARETELGKSVESKKLGFTVDPYSTQDINNLIRKLINNDDLRDVKSCLEKLNNEELFWENESIKLYDFI